MVDRNAVVRCLVEDIDLETGIRLDADDLAIEIDGATLAVTFRGKPFCQLDDLDDELDDEDIAVAITEAVGDVKERLVALKLVS